MKIIKKWLSNKYNLTITILTAVFVVFALLSYLVPQISIISMLSLSGAVFVLALKLHKKHKEMKNVFYSISLTGQLTAQQVKQFKYNLLQNKVTFISLYFLALAILYIVSNQLYILVA